MGKRLSRTVTRTGGELCIPGYAKGSDAQVGRLDAQLEAWNADLPRLHEFILPGGGGGN